MISFQPLAATEEQQLWHFRLHNWHCSAKSGWMVPDNSKPFCVVGRLTSSLVFISIRSEGCRKRLFFVWETYDAHQWIGLLISLWWLSPYRATATVVGLTVEKYKFFQVTLNEMTWVRQTPMRVSLPMLQSKMKASACGEQGNAVLVCSWTEHVPTSQCS